MNWIRNKQQWRDYLLITLGTAVMAVATSSIYDPAGLVTGGFSGLAIVIKQLSQMLFGKGVPLWVTNLVLNIPLFLFGIRMSRDFLVKTIFGTLMNTFWIAVLPVLQLVPDDRMLSALFGGVLMGAGIGLVFIGNGTTGGTDMMAALIQRKLRHYSVAQVMQVLDGIIVIAGIFVFGIHASLYAIVAIYVTTKVTDALMEGMNYAKSAFIITAHPEQVFDALITDPPYASGGWKASEKNRTTNQKYSSMDKDNALPDFDGDQKDQRSWTRWMAEWLSDARKVCKPGAPICLFIDWRQYPSITDALQWAGWIWRGSAVWDKMTSRPQRRAGRL